MVCVHTSGPRHADLVASSLLAKKTVALLKAVICREITYFLFRSGVKTPLARGTGTSHAPGWVSI